MKFEQHGKNYAFEPATGDIGEVAPGELVDMTNPAIMSKPLIGGKLGQLTLEVTQQCNLRCVYCPHTHQGVPGIRAHQDVHMTWDIAQAAMSQVETRGGDDVVVAFYGGEPLLNFELIKRVVETWPQYQYDIDTNGQAVTREIAEWAAGYRIRWQISVDGSWFENDRYRGEGTMGKVLDAIYYLEEGRSDVEIRLACTLAPPWDCLRSIAEQFDVFAANGFPFTVNFADLEGSSIEAEPLSEVFSTYRRGYIRDCKAGLREQFSPFWRQLFEPALIRLYHRKKDQRFSRWVPGGCCNPGVRKLYATATGQLFPCEKTGMDSQIGDVWGGVDWPAVQVMHKEFYEQRKAKGCAECSILRLCGGCWAEPVDCDNKKHQVEATMKMFVELADADALGWLKETSQS